MEDLKQSVVHALDGSDKALYPFLPYLLQDLQEIGSSPEVILSMIQKNIHLFSDPVHILDLGCGKGAVSIHLAKHLGWHALGIDGMPAFIENAKSVSVREKVDDFCTFEVGDIRQKILFLQNYDCIILGSIGPVFGDIETTLNKVSSSLKPSGYVILDDGYTDDTDLLADSNCLSKESIHTAIHSAGFEIVDEYIFSPSEMKESDDFIYRCIQKRSDELMKKIPEKKALFVQYVEQQQKENEILENRMICVTWLLKKCVD